MRRLKIQRVHAALTIGSVVLPPVELEHAFVESAATQSFNMVRTFVPSKADTSLKFTYTFDLRAELGISRGFASGSTLPVVGSRL